jgi:hypothetical protein
MKSRIGIFVTLAVLLALIPSMPYLLGQQYVQTGRAYAPDYWTGGGTANAQTVTPVPAWASLITGNAICWLPTAANTTTTPTLAVSGLTAKTITKLGHTALAANDLTTTAIACAIYDGTDYQLQNPQVVSGSGTVNSGTANQAACYASTGTAVSGCPNLTDTSGGQTITTVALESKFVITNQGTAQTSGNIAITNWGSGAAVSAVGGYDNTEWFTITAGTTPSASPTIVVTFPDTFPVTPKCSMQQIGGTGVIADVTSGTETTTSSGTMTWLATPTNTQTYLFKLMCGS